MIPAVSVAEKRGPPRRELVAVLLARPVSQLRPRSICAGARQSVVHADAVARCLAAVDTPRPATPDAPNMRKAAAARRAVSPCRPVLLTVLVPVQEHVEPRFAVEQRPPERTVPRFVGLAAGDAARPAVAY